jgi:hypothetical protein
MQFIEKNGQNVLSRSAQTLFAARRTYWVCWQPRNTRVPANALVVYKDSLDDQFFRFKKHDSRARYCKILKLSCAARYCRRFQHA